MTGSNDRSFNVWRLSGALCDFNNDLRPTSEATVDWRIQGIPLQIESFRHLKRLSCMKISYPVNVLLGIQCHF